MKDHVEDEMMKVFSALLAGSMTPEQGRAIALSASTLTRRQEVRFKMAQALRAISPLDVGEAAPDAVPTIEQMLAGEHKAKPRGDVFDVQQGTKNGKRRTASDVELDEKITAAMRARGLAG